jgi:hypothetical protein
MILVPCFATKESKSIVKLLSAGKHQVSTSQFVRKPSKTSGTKHGNNMQGINLVVNNALLTLVTLGTKTW